MKFSSSGWDWYSLENSEDFLCPTFASVLAHDAFDVTGPTDMVMRVGHFLQLNFCPSPPLWTKEKTLSPLRKPILTSTANVFLIFFFSELQYAP